MSRNYKFHNPQGLYFISFATVYWIDVFTREVYSDCIVKNLNYCASNKGMEIYAWCLMTNHVHMVFKSVKEKPEAIIRDFKSFTSKELIELIKKHPQESRKDWMLSAFKKAASINSNNLKNQFWQQHNKPIELWSNEVIEQKINYTHNNPVVSGFVEKPESWKYSSAKDYCNEKGLVHLCLI